MDLKHWLYTINSIHTQVRNTSYHNEPFYENETAIMKQNFSTQLFNKVKLEHQLPQKTEQKKSKLKI